VTLLLPLDPITNDRDLDRIVSPEFVKDHIMLCDPVSASSTSTLGCGTIVTLSGLRGVLVSDG
jgi:hypothetical protein